MKSSSNFQTGALILFGAAVIIAIVIFAATKISSGGTKPTVVLWGTQNQDAMIPILQSFDSSGSAFSVRYVQKSADAFDTDFVSALAAGTGPDAVIIPDSAFSQRKNLFYTIPYASYPQRTYLDTFAPEAQNLLSADGVTAMPLLVDPLVMYWNRDLFAKAGSLIPPKTWDDFNTLAPKISIFDKTLRLSQSLVALGDASNVPHSKELLLTLWLQAICSDASKSCAIDPANPPSDSLSIATQFYAGFADPSAKIYSWNHSEPDAKTAFLAGTLATYFGYASELPDLQKKNANLNFDMAYLPQALNAPKQVTYGAMTVFAILKNSRNLAAAFSLGVALSGHDSDSAIAQAFGISPMRSDLLSAPPEDAYSPIIYGSVYQAHGWQDPNPAETSSIFSRLVGDTVSGASSGSDASDRAAAEIAQLANSQNPQ